MKSKIIALFGLVIFASCNQKKEAVQENEIKKAGNIGRKALSSFECIHAISQIE